ncbi:Fur family transcriptional regulator [Streptomyces ochraceiscleroticus]|uniref:Fur family transcriptional regulator n=1 Tax=Streptomyces ochraceiscleroticus TaxID=47761 RepID=UPI0004C8ECFF|nr:Fur family transcriptional regulator [Streptomyces ochraceiscleroticus]
MTGAKSSPTRNTPQRAAVLRALGNCQDFVSAQMLHARLVTADCAVGLTTVYRALHQLQATGQVDVVRDGTGERLYRRRSTAGHQHYLLCRDCGRSRPVDSRVVERWAERIGETSGFTDVEHTVELTGVCGRCRPTAH